MDIDEIMSNRAVDLLARNKELKEALEKIQKITRTKSEIHRPEPLVKPTWICFEQSDFTELEIIICRALAKPNIVK